jgi:gamma-glutamyltranspeptidase/glutathione hydrolase
MVDFDMGPQQAIDALRFSVDLEGGVTLEEAIDPSIVKGLEAKGHTVGIREGYSRVTMGGAQIIERNAATGVLTGASEPRKSGSAVGW